jgi:hypothetical protein
VEWADESLSQNSNSDEKIKPGKVELTKKSMEKEVEDLKMKLHSPNSSSRSNEEISSESYYSAQIAGHHIPNIQM